MEFTTPRSILNAYRNGFMGAICDPEETAGLLAELKTPLFGAAAYKLFGSGEGKLSTPFKSLLKFDPGFGPSEAQTTGDCFHPETIVIGDRCKEIQDVEVGDKICSGDGRYTTVISKQLKTSYSPMITIKTMGGFPLRVTADHRVMVGRKTGQREWEEATKERRDFPLLCKERPIVKQWVAAQDIKKGDFLITPVDLETADMPINKFTISQDFEWFLGYFLGDGWCSYKELKITFARHQTSFFDRCQAFLKQLGFNARKEAYRGKRQTTSFRLRCWCPELATFLRNLSYDANKNKLFPSWGIGNEDVVQGLVDSDGFRSDRKETFDSKSASLAYGVYYSFLKMGYKPTINKFHRSKRGSYKNSLAYRVACIYEKKKNYSFVLDNNLYISVMSIEVAEGPHEVYDIGVADESHSFLADGKVVHNCVSHATRNAVDITRAVEIDVNGEAESFEGRSATEGIYQSRTHSGEGMTCSGAASYVHKQGGILLRKKYGSVDLSVYNSNTGANKSIPRSIWIDEAQKHQVKTISMITTVQEARDALANGYSISVCSGLGFSSKRDAKGVAKRSGGWNHAMTWIACDDTRERFNEMLFLIQNSWGLWNNGPKIHGQPDGSFWIREQEAREMLASQGSWVFSNVDGFPARDLPDYGVSTFL